MCNNFILDCCGREIVMSARHLAVIHTGSISITYTLYCSHTHFRYYGSVHIPEGAPPDIS